MENALQITLSRLRDDFISRLPQRLAVLEKLLAAVARGENGAIEILHREAHSLVGAAGVHRLMGVSEAARKLERIVADLPTDKAAGATRVHAMREALAQLVAVAAHPSIGFVPPPPTAGQTVSPRILVVDDDAEQAVWLRSVLEDAGYRVEVFDELAAFRAACCEPELPAAIIMDMVFPEGDNAGAQAIAEMKAQSQIGLPVIFLSVRQDIAARLAAYRAGATRYLTKPVGRDTLLWVMADAAALKPAQAYRVLLVDDDPDQLAVHAHILRQAGMDVREANDPLQVPGLLDDFAAEMLLLDMYMPQCSGPELAAILSDDERHAEIPIVYLSAETDIFRQLLALDRGGDHFLTKPVEPRHLVAATVLHAKRFRGFHERTETTRATLYEWERQQQALDAHAIVSVADPAGNITYINDKFCEISGYRRDELMGKSHRIVKSGEHPPEFYQDLWHTISSGNIWQGEICNRCKDGSLYWVETSIVPFLDANGLPYQYISIRTDITHIVEAEQRLRRSQIYANIGTWDWNIQTGALFWSERIGPLFGYPEGSLETTYENFLAAVHPDDRQNVIDAISACVERHCDYEIEHRVVWPDGTVRWLLERGDVVRNQDGMPLHMLGVVQDIDERKRAELMLVENEKRLREAQTLAHIGDWKANLESGELIWSEEIFHIFGRDQAIFKPSVEDFQAAVHPDDRALVEESERHAAQTGLHDVVHRIVRPDGTVRHVHELARSEHDATGKLVCLAGTVQDITERIEAAARLRETEERFSFAVEGTGDGIWDWNMLSGEMPLSGHYEAMLGFEKGDLEPTIDAWFKNVHPDDLARVQQSMQDYLAGKLPVYAVELRLRCKDGGHKWILCRSTVVRRDDMGKPVRMIGIHSDISEHKAVEAALVEARESAERANQAKSDFLSSMSHELRTPMNAILGFAQMLEYDSALNADQQDNVNEILKGGHHLLELINEVLDLAKIESGRIDLSLEPVGLAGLAEGCRQLIQPLAAARQIVLRLDIPAETAVRADSVRLKQVLLNLLSNAVKYNRKGGEIRVGVQASAAERLRITVADTGAGIAPERMAELFLPFNRLDEEYSEIEGTGIGLTITRRLMELMGGEVGVDSQVGTGTTFWIELPAETVATLDTTAVSGGAAPQPGAPLRRHLVLCIDDNPVNLKLIAQMLGMRRHIQLITAHTPKLGIELALAHRPELILLDINMPGMDGYQVLEVLKADALLKSIPVVAVTANAMPRDIERGRAAGFSDYLTKPLDLNQFLKTIDRCLAGSEENAA